MLAHSIFLLAGLILLVAGAEGLVRGSSGLAARLGVSPLAIGLSIVAFGTGSPEFTVGLQAAASAQGDIAIGNALGSNICNIGLILGLSALARPMAARSNLIRREMPILLAVTLALLLMLLDRKLSRAEGAVLLASSFLYTLYVYLAAKRDRQRAVHAEYEAVIEAKKPKPIIVDLSLLSGGLISLFAGSSLALNGAVYIASSLGVSQLVIGLTVVSLGTGLPELATSLLASIKRQADVAFGNIIGSNIFNILAVVGAVALVKPLELESLRALDLAVFAASPFLLFALMWRGRGLGRSAGALLLGGYSLYLYSLAA